MFYTYLSIYLKDFLHLTITESTLYATLPMIMSVLFQNFVWGPISDKFQRRRTLIITGEILAGIGTLIVWLIHFNINNLILAGYAIIIGLMIIEAFWSMSNIGWSALISDIYPSLDRSKVMGALTSIGGLGRMIGILIGGYWYFDGYGFRYGILFFASSFMMFISTIPMFFIPEGGIKYNRNANLIEDDKPVKQSKLQYTFIVFIIALTLINFGRNSISVTYSQYLTLADGFHVDSILLSYIANTRSVSVLIIGFFAGYLSRKMGHSNTMIFGTVVAIASILITALTYDLSLIFVGSFLIGVGDVIIAASSYALASDLIPEAMRGKLFGVYNTTFFLSWGLSSTIISAPVIDILLIGGMPDVIAYQISFLIGSFITFLGIIIFISLNILQRIHKKKGKKEFRL
jgi:MFS family permease